MNAETRQAVDDAVRRVGARDRAVLQRCEDLAMVWRGRARNASDELAQALRQCADELDETLAGPDTPPPTATAPVVRRPRWRSRFALALGGAR